MRKLLLITLFSISAVLSQAQNRQLSGKVTDADTGDPLIAVSVHVKGKTNGTATDVNGNYKLTLPAGAADLEVSYLGYVTSVIAVNNQTQLNIKLKAQSKNLNEVVVVGYGTVRKRDLTGSVVSLKSDEIKKVPAANLLESVQGKLPGVDITRSNGSAGSPVNITVRGNRSISANNGPLVIVDGIQYNSIQDINPNDIASMDVLKDASSTAIYGSRGANGVIIITTKKGVSGKATVSFNAYSGITQVAAYPQFMNAQGFMDALREANKRTTDYPNGVWQSTADDSKLTNITAAELKNYQNGLTTDYPSKLISNGSQSEYQLGVTAGSENTKVYLSGDFYKENGLLKNNNLNRYTGRFNIDQNIGKIVKVGMQSQITYYNQNNRTDNALNIANRISPLTTPFDEAGNYIILPRQKDVNPLLDNEVANYTNNTLLTRTLGAAYVEVKPTQSLTIRSNFGIVLNNSRNGIFRGKNSVERYLSGTSQSFAKDSTGYEMTWENILTYNKKINAHNFTFTGVTTYLERKSDYLAAQGNNQLLPDNLFYALSTNAQDYVIGSGYSKENLISFTGRLNYDYKSKYLLSLTGRTDGSSKLSAGNKWSLFPSAAFAWRIIEESFMKKLPVFTDLKLRVSYGVSGNDAISPYATQGTLTRIPFSFGSTANYGYAFSSNLNNPDLKWELTRTANLGLDIGLFDSWITATVDVYDAHTSNLLLNTTLPQTGGIGSIIQNSGKTRNTGIDFSLTSNNIRSKNVSWNTTFTFFSNKERIVELPNNANDIVNGWFIGSPVRVFYDYKKLGIWQLNERDAAAVYKQKPGDIKVLDVNGDGKINSTTDRVIVGQNSPKWNGGFNSDFRYKNFDFNVFVFARIGQTLNYSYYTRYDPSLVDNIPAADYWTEDNPSNLLPRPRAGTTAAGLLYGSTLGYVDGSFVKIRNATLGYTVNATQLKSKLLSSVRIYVTGKNLLTFSKFKNTYDPESNGAIDLPMTRLFMAGLNVGF
jgi:TonB-linked SusC/RagA family outer membrane protein